MVFIFTFIEYMLFKFLGQDSSYSMNPHPSRGGGETIPSNQRGGIPIILLEERGEGIVKKGTAKQARGVAVSWGGDTYSL